MPKKTTKPAAKSAKKSTKRPATPKAATAAAVKKVQAVSKQADTLAKKNPWALAGIAAGLGIAVGLLSRGGAKRKKR